MTKRESRTFTSEFKKRMIQLYQSGKKYERLATWKKVVWTQYMETFLCIRKIKK
ncbi:hypothetical protein ACQKGI_21710 [Peribacillus muralis]|uniref:hypothetical protein n=1 Tax=Peribacillus muralis TaxID=264697 RepID=UPI0037F9D1F9